MTHPYTHTQFPYLVDPNTNTAMYESDAIINYLFDTYGPGAADVSWLFKGPIAIIAAGVCKYDLTYRPLLVCKHTSIYQGPNCYDLLMFVVSQRCHHHCWRI